jgi:hypothetical protein
MKLLYLYIEDYGSLNQVAFNLDANERFHHDEYCFEYKRLGMIADLNCEWRSDL